MKLPCVFKRPFGANASNCYDSASDQGWKISAQKAIFRCYSQTDRQTETRKNRLKKKLNILYQTEMDKTNRKQTEKDRSGKKDRSGQN